MQHLSLCKEKDSWWEKWSALSTYTYTVDTFILKQFKVRKWLHLWLPWQDEKEATGIYNIFVDNTFILQKYLLNKQLNQLIHDYHLSKNRLCKSENEWKLKNFRPWENNLNQGLSSLPPRQMGYLVKWICTVVSHQFNKRPVVSDLSI